jgi:hypothetical protein
LSKARQARPQGIVRWQICHIIASAQDSWS